jgi:hypothetical protein
MTIRTIPDTDDLAGRYSTVSSGTASVTLHRFLRAMGAIGAFCPVTSGLPRHCAKLAESPSGKGYVMSLPPQGPHARGSATVLT